MKRFAQMIASAIAATTRGLCPGMTDSLLSLREARIADNCSQRELSLSISKRDSEWYWDFPIVIELN